MASDPRLDWFRQRAGTETDFPERLPNGDLLATRAKGIYKPANSRFALSVRTQLNSKYQDGIFISIFDGGWAFAYHQETDKRLGDRIFTNRALDENILHHRPVGVLQEVAIHGKKGTKYFVHGVAVPIHKQGAYYILCDEFTAAAYPKLQILNAFFLSNASTKLGTESELSEGVDELQLQTFKTIVARQGQGKFRRILIDAYNGSCAISGESTLEVLDAAHINPYEGKKTNTVNNGLLIRTDFHNLFDFNLLAINPNDYIIHIHKLVDSDYYQSISGSKLMLPKDKRLWPELKALQSRWRIFSGQIS